MMPLRMITANKKYLQLTVIVSLVVGFLIHFPELVSLTDTFEQQTLFPGMTPADVLFEVGYTFLSLFGPFAVNTYLFGFNESQDMYDMVESDVVIYSHLDIKQTVRRILCLLAPEFQYSCH